MNLNTQFIIKLILKTFSSRIGEEECCPIHEFTRPFFSQNANMKVTSVHGHIFTRDFDKKLEYNKIHPFELFDTDTIKKVVDPERKIIENLQKEATDCKYLVLWLDNDKEGENICFEVIDVVNNHLHKIPNFETGRSQNVFRAKFSSITAEDIIHAYNNLKSVPNINESLSVDARQEIDLKIGVTYSRFMSMHLKKSKIIHLIFRIS